MSPADVGLSEEAATSLGDLAALPGNRFEALRGDRKDNTAFASMTNGGFALNGLTERRGRLA